MVYFSFPFGEINQRCSHKKFCNFTSNKGEFSLPCGDNALGYIPNRVNNISQIYEVHQSNSCALCEFIPSSFAAYFLYKYISGFFGCSNSSTYIGKGDNFTRKIEDRQMNQATEHIRKIMPLLQASRVCNTHVHEETLQDDHKTFQTGRLIPLC